MLSTAERFYTTVGGIAGLGVILLRMSYQLGGFIRELRNHVKSSEATAADHELRLRAMERGRK